ncbi:MAG: hypothetical protein PHO27_11970 [Sulfuricurvum sp.]|jgi:hypothetical protein|nr:hypothetical protein [Sulfuricurvum sp.]
MGREGIDFSQKLTESGLTGKLYFSKKQWKEQRDKGRDRTFAAMDDGQLKEYTELISADMLKEDPYDTCYYDDAYYVGVGSFHHFADERGRRVG